MCEVLDLGLGLGLWSGLICCRTVADVVVCWFFALSFLPDLTCCDLSCSEVSACCSGNQTPKTEHAKMHSTARSVILSCPAAQQANCVCLLLMHSLHALPWLLLGGARKEGTARKL